MILDNERARKTLKTGKDTPIASVTDIFNQLTE